MITTNQYKTLRETDASLKYIEDKIDAAIMFGASCARPIRVQVLRGWSTEGIERVLREYRAAGWAAEVIPDSRDGSYIELRTTGQ